MSEREKALRNDLFKLRRIPNASPEIKERIRECKSLLADVKRIEGLMRPTGIVSVGCCE